MRRPVQGARAEYRRHGVWRRYASRGRCVSGGVARNEAVRRHLERITGAPLLTHPQAPLFGAIGAALCCLERGAVGARAQAPPPAPPPHGTWCRSSPLIAALCPAGYGRPRLSLPAARFLRQSCRAPRAVATCFTGPGFSARHPVEVEIFSQHGPGSVPVRMGIDVGSTSTKAILVDGTGRIRSPASTPARWGHPSQRYRRSARRWSRTRTPPV